ncbi:hypothetical protein BD324DRAFT_649753 [Kockovaella imperatae]|uniref:Ribosome biogenesis protein SLX9 n=1 Tax=Kockovaella imperatae TaxID=4999 RepID=A0A1Y1UJZ7_9TREE|nr:hypothetical protein BD324DRAFT_649753 [Kockovaella imperatae]ORX38381.1 hypothetical protein BD324DRAFT_649753 [Kockovaella imperatae]
MNGFRNLKISEIFVDHRSPRISRQKAVKRHASAVQLPVKRSFAVDETQVVESVVPGNEPGPSRLKPTRPPMESSTEPPVPAHPYSRSHVRREKRKAKQQLAGGQLHDMAVALSQSLGETEPESKARVRTKEEKEKERQRREQEQKVGAVGKSRTLKERKRRKEITTEARRLPAVVNLPVFKQNPWETIRIHATNTIALKDKI